MHEKMTTGDERARREMIRSVVSGITVGDGRIRIIGDETVLVAAVTGQRNRNGFVRGHVREWRTLAGENENWVRVAVKFERTAEGAQMDFRDIAGWSHRPSLGEIV